MVLKLPLTSAASTKGLDRYRGFCAGGGGGAKIELGATVSMGEVTVLFEGVGDLFWTRCVPRAIDRLHTDEFGLAI